MSRVHRCCCLSQKSPFFFYLLHAETAILKEKLLFLEAQLAQAEKREEWLKGQVETAQETIKLLEHKQSPKRVYSVVCLVQSIRNDLYQYIALIM